jgi:hypothetical protein
MSLRNFKSVQKIQNVVLIYLVEPTTTEWDDTTMRCDAGR